jgi:hypothetical protein
MIQRGKEKASGVASSLPRIRGVQLAYGSVAFSLLRRICTVWSFEKAKKEAAISRELALAVK